MSIYYDTRAWLRRKAVRGSQKADEESLEADPNPIRFDRRGSRAANHHTVLISKFNKVIDELVSKFYAPNSLHDKRRMFTRKNIPT